MKVIFRPYTCVLKGALNDVTMSWDGKQFLIDEQQLSRCEKNAGATNSFRWWVTFPHSLLHFLAFEKLRGTLLSALW